ncbi:hypothetical protein HYS97_02630 [Candidatus Daviesbacteria bacterium]|nr:hypothetical protein [Candidatus Daviesbacteria bacterium]
MNQEDITEARAAFFGFNEVMKGWVNTFEGIGLNVVPVTLTGLDLTADGLRRHEQVIKENSQETTFIMNTHDGLNSRGFKHFEEAANNDNVGEIFADQLSNTYIICTNIDGVRNKDGQIIRNFNNLDQLNNIEFWGASNNGKGGMETKLWSAIRFALSKKSRVTYIVDGRMDAVLLRVLLYGEELGTKVQFT